MIKKKAMKAKEQRDSETSSLNFTEDDRQEFDWFHPDFWLYPPHLYSLYFIKKWREASKNQKLLTNHTDKSYHQTMNLSIKIILIILTVLFAPNLWSIPQDCILALILFVFLVQVNRENAQNVSKNVKYGSQIWLH